MGFARLFIILPLSFAGEGDTGGEVNPLNYLMAKVIWTVVVISASPGLIGVVAPPIAFASKANGEAIGGE